MKDRNMIKNCKHRINELLTMTGVAALLFFTGCGTTNSSMNSQAQAAKPDSIVLAEGDVIKVVFPSASNLDTTAQIRRDGKITLPVIGEIQAAGMTPQELEKDLKKHYAGQLVSDEINVSVVSSSFSVYVTGAVLRPGKVSSDRPMTALDAIMESGGPDYSRANLKGVLITRKIKGRMEHFKINVQGVLKGQSTEAFDLRPNDIVYVPEKFSWF